jgi:hypothetical protein
MILRFGNSASRYASDWLTCKRIENVRRIVSYGIGLLLWLPGITHAQRVMYSESVSRRSADRFQLIGKSGSFYWVQKLQKRKSKNHNRYPDLPDIQSFELLDTKLNLLSETAAADFPETVKQWLLSGKDGLDQIMVVPSAGKTAIVCSHFGTGEIQQHKVSVIDSLPFSKSASRFILVRSEDQSKLLLLYFESMDEGFTRLHTVLFDSGWNVIYHQVIPHIFFAQPFIQDDEIGFPAESFDNFPVKLANNGEWLLASSSRTSRSFSVFHVCANGSEYYIREIPVSPYYKMEDIAMAIDNDRQEMSVGFLSCFSNTTLKNVHVCNYSMREDRFDFDTSYHFNTQVRDLRDKNLSHSGFIAVPGGYMLLKEYGSPHEFNLPVVPFVSSDESAYLLANYSEQHPGKDKIKDGYTLTPGLNPIPFVQHTGDLNLFYFPAIRKDSVWSAVLDTEQHTEQNSPDLSYLTIPMRNKLYIIYNRPDGYSNALATTTSLNIHGQTTDDALIFWEMKKLLNFQRSRRIATDEVAVPYMNNQQSGFAIIRLQSADVTASAQ